MVRKRDLFLAYCSEYSYGKKRDKPLNPRTLGRYLRGLQLVEKLIETDLENVTENDQLVFMERILPYAQGTRRVSTQIFQRYIAWGIKNGHLSCKNLIFGQEALIIGPNTQPNYEYISKRHMREFFRKLKTPVHRVLFGLIYYGGLHSVEASEITKDNITDTGVFLYRETRKESQLLPLPPRFLKEIHEYAASVPDGVSFLGLSNKLEKQSEVSDRWKSATIEAGELIGTSVRDLRTTGIRHFFELSNNLELTKQFAGVPDTKGGWLDELADASTYHMRTVAKARSFHGSTNSEAARAK